jgi:hypothetical protein
MELDLQSLFELNVHFVHSCNHWLGSGGGGGPRGGGGGGGGGGGRGAILVSQDRRHLSVTPSPLSMINSFFDTFFARVRVRPSCPGIQLGTISPQLLRIIEVQNWFLNQFTYLFNARTIPSPL